MLKLPAENSTYDVKSSFSGTKMISVLFTREHCDGCHGNTCYPAKNAMQPINDINH